ncbi:MAG: putative motility protein [Devosia sp.]|nr:putative motility protein [Devosia sp.]
MEADLASTLIAARSSMTQQSVQLAVVKKAHDMQTQLLEMLLQPAQAVLPPGQGTQVDKSA